MFQNFSIDRLSFWVGFIGGGLFFWIVSVLRLKMPQIRKTIKTRIQSTRESMTAGVDLRFRSDILRFAQRQHLASPLFSLEEVLISPHLMSPPPQVRQDEDEGIALDCFSQVVPYIPDWPELSSALGTAPLTLAEALQEGANLLLLGNPGGGKTVALAHLASLASRRSPDLGNLSGHLPIFLHAADLPLPLTENKELLSVLIEGAAENASPLTLPRLGKLIRDVIEGDQALLLLDGLDELPPDELDLVVDYLRSLLKSYPKIRLVAAASFDYYGGLAALGLVPVALATWSLTQRDEFLQRWSDLWERFIHRQNPEVEEVDSLLLNNWLKDNDIFATPLEFTLKVWAAYAGDARGSTPVDSIEAYLERAVVHLPKARPSLEKIAAQNLVEMRFAFTAKEREKLISSFSGGALTEVEDSTLVEAEQADQEVLPVRTDSKEKDARQKGSSDKIDGQQMFSDLINAGLLVSRKGSRANLVHPVIAAYLASLSLANSTDWTEILEQPTWSAKTLTLRYLSMCVDLSFYVTSVFEQRDDPTQRKMLQVWQWMRDIPKSVRWRPVAMRKTAMAVQDDTLSLALRGRGLAALASTKDPGASVLFRQFLQHHMGSIRQFGALGCGLTRDIKALPDLVLHLEDSNSLVRKASLLALGAVNNKSAMDAIADELLHGSEEMRRTAAEVLATLPEEGHPALLEGSGMEDLLVRRAVVYGLARIRQPWASQLLEQMQIEDGQWVVRAAASQAVEELNRPDPHIPRPLPALLETPWLILFAGKQGMGVSNGKAALELILQALKSGEEKEKLAALEYLANFGNAETASQIYHLLYGTEGELKEAAYHALWSISASGAELPSPVQFGLG